MRAVKEQRRVHIIGIGGAGMSAIAIVLKDAGYDVTGSDIKRSRYVEFVESRGIKVSIGHDEKNVLDRDIVIYSTAIPESNPELRKARELGLKVMHRSDALCLIGKNRKLIAVTGSHGKTTTTSLLAHSLRSAGIEAGFIVGGEVNDYGSNADSGSHEFFVIEADESDGTFLKIQPFCSVFTNLEPEHMDYFGSEEALLSAAERFIAGTSQFSVVCADDKRLAKILDETDAGNIITYGFNRGDFRVEGYSETDGKTVFRLKTPDKGLLDFSIKLRGRHNVLNAAGVAALLLNLGIDCDSIKKGFSTFNGVGRRLQLIYQDEEVAVYDDYAHHPTEIRCVLESLKKAGFRRVLAVFQPHRYSRTYHLLNDFPEAFEPADAILLTEIYDAGENPIPGITGKLLFEVVAEKNPHKELFFVPRLVDIPWFVSKIVRSGDAVVFMGAGDITIAARETAGILEEEK